MRLSIVMMTAVSLIAVPLAAQPTVSPASLGLIVYPAKGQPPAQQQQDEGECYQWARQQTGIDPTAPGVTAAQVDKSPDGSMVKGAAGGALAGTAIGAIAGDTGKGAAIGATAGAIRGRRQSKARKKEEEKEAQQQAQTQNQQTKGTFGKAMSACLEGRGYSVK
jgi:Glycine zipper